MHTPLTHVSFVHRSPSEHTVPSTFAGFVHTPVPTLQNPAPVCRHGFVLGHVFAGLAVHVPDRHTSGVQKFESA